MMLQCAECGTKFDDARCWGRRAPHVQLMSDADLARKDAAIELVGRRVCFAHQPDGPAHDITSVSRDGMVTLADMIGSFAPHLFVIARRLA